MRRSRCEAWDLGPQQPSVIEPVSHTERNTDQSRFRSRYVGKYQAKTRFKTLAWDWKTSSVIGKISQTLKSVRSISSPANATLIMWEGPAPIRNYLGWNETARKFKSRNLSNGSLLWGCLTSDTFEIQQRTKEPWSGGSSQRAATAWV